MTIGEKIAKLRASLSLSQEELAEKIGVSRQSISKWEMNQSDPRMDKMPSLCHLFGVTADNLLNPDVILPMQTDRFPPSVNGLDCHYFGTDGFRGEAGKVLTAEHAFRVGRFLGWYLGSPLSGRHDKNVRPKIVIGKDTRRSSYTLEYAMAAGITASGADAYILHVTTTPSVSFVTRHDNFDCGVMISASHNTYSDNGIKLVNANGEKMDDKTLALIEAYLDRRMELLGLPSDGDLPMATMDRIGSAVDHVAGRNRYIGYLISLAAHSYRDLRIGLDCANGSSWMIAPAVFEALGAKVKTIGTSPDGQNINRETGSTHIAALQELVRREHLDMGFAFDGDADRCIAVDEKGNEVNGDKILYILANRLKGLNNLAGNTVVTSVMSNAGLTRALTQAGIDTLQAPVGDKYVWEEMKKGGYSLGGEQSGHVILQKYATTGDGILTALMLTEEMLDRKQPLSALGDPVQFFPQILKNLKVSNKAEVMQDNVIAERLSEISRELGNSGRILLRPSGTEPVIRIMAEALDARKCSAYVTEIADLICRRGYARL